jgi:hypothetical protein
MSDKVFQIIVRDSGEVYPSLESFRFEIETMVDRYGLPADIVDIIEITRGRERGSSPTTSPGPELNTDYYTHVEFHDVAGANIE